MSAVARRALKTLETLARARDRELTELKRAANAAADRLQRAEHAMIQLQATILAEGTRVQGDPHIMAAYVGFAGNARLKLRQLAVQREALKHDVEEAEAAVLDAYRALKQIEEAADARREEIAAEAARKERAEADDMAAIRATRRR